MSRPEPVASVIVRTKDSAATVLATITSLRAQSVPVEIVVVDSGSSDGTLALVEPLVDQVVRIRPEDFTFGHSLNVGAGAASSDVHIALSSHCVLPQVRWVETAAAHVRAGATGVFGSADGPDREPLPGPLRVDHGTLMANQWWGFTNHASAWSAAAWAAAPFDETLPASEDKEWSWRATRPDGFLVADPTLVVPGDHRRRAGVRAYYRRCVKEMTAFPELRPLAPFGPAQALTDFARPTPRDPFLTRTRPFGRTRLVEIMARYAAGRKVRGRGF